jgi:ACS family tartrate transporter-like MFS transporter
MPTLPSAPDPAGRSAIRKATWRLIPLIALGYGTAYMDRVNISFASLQMNRDLHFSATVYGLGSGLFFLSYAACEIPSNLALYRFGAKRWLARIMVTWGLLAMLMLFVRTPIQFYSLRFLLGMAEAGFFPGIVFYLTQWFPAELRARAFSRFYIALPLSSVFMGSIAGALLNLNGRLGIAGWQWLFLVEGLPAVLLGIVFLIYLPDSPAKANWLTADERSYILRRVREDAPPHGHASHSVGRALADPRVWQLGVFMMLMLGSLYATTFYLPDIIAQSTHYTPTTVGFIIAGFNLLAAAAMILGAIHSDRTRERYWHVIVPAVISAAACVVCGVSNLPWLLLPALAVINVAYTAMQGPVWALPGSFFTGRSAAAGIAAMNMVGILGGFLGPYAMGYAKDLTGTYQRGLLLLAIPWLIAVVLMLYIRSQALARQSQLPHPRAARVGS